MNEVFINIESNAQKHNKSLSRRWVYVLNLLIFIVCCLLNIKYFSENRFALIWGIIFALFILVLSVHFFSKAKSTYFIRANNAGIELKKNYWLFSKKYAWKDVVAVSTYNNYYLRINTTSRTFVFDALYIKEEELSALLNLANSLK